MRDERTILDVCHNPQGFEAVFESIRVNYPEIKKVKIAFAISKKKKLEDVVDLFESTELISEVHVISRPHMRLIEADKAHNKMTELGSNKL